MGLHDQAALDARSFLEDVTGGFGQDVTVTDPFGFRLALKGFVNRVGQQIDPDTGVMVSGDITTVALPVAALVAGGRGIPKGVSDTSSTPWVVSFADLQGVVSKFKVRETNQDRTLGVVVCILEQWIG